MASALEKARQGTSNLRKRVVASRPVETISAFLAGAMVGTLERNGFLPATVIGMPTKPLIAGAAYLLGSGRLGTMGDSVAHGAADGIAGAYGYAAGKGGTLIAGLDDSTEVGDSEDLQLGV
jgi:hypothetical protein